jgi:hypothetical protein
MIKFLKTLGFVAAAALVGCGGGGGSSGTTSEPYSITLRAAKSQLPLNIANQPASIGAYAAYTTTLYVEARQGATAIPGGTGIFGCNLVQGLDSGALYYLDGNSEHEDDKKNPLAYRAITLDANSGGASFHFHAGNQSGTARITCSVTDPRDKQVRTATVAITVGGTANGKPASVRGVAQAPGYLGSRDNLAMLSNNVGLQAFVMDDSNQPVPNSASANLQVSIRPFGASTGARLLSGGQSGNVLQINTSGGIGSFALSSGPSSGIILLELVTDRFDNDVSNGIQDAVTSLLAVSVVDAVASTPLVFGGDDLTLTNTLPFASVLSATGGVPPYNWSFVGSLPPGMTLSSSGVISGTPLAAPGVYTIAVTVTDATGAQKTASVKLTVSGALPFDPFVFSVNGCTSAVNTPCPLPNATTGSSYLYAFSATGGDPAQTVSWAFTNLPGWLVSGSTGNTGFIRGTPGVADKCTTSNFFVTVTRGALVVTRQVSVKVDDIPPAVCP